MKVLLMKIYNIWPPVVFIFLMFYISFYTSTDIIFHNFLELDYLKKDFHHEIFVFNGFTHPPPPPPPPHPLSFNRQNPLSVTKVFCQCPVLCPQKSERQ